MLRFFSRVGPTLSHVLATLLIAGVWVTPSSAITAGQIDNFNDGTTQHWRVGQSGYSVPNNAANAGSLGAGDHALYYKCGGIGFPSRLIVLNEANSNFPGPGNWEGNWTAASIKQISLDVRNPMPGGTLLYMRLGIAGPGGAASSGDVYVTDEIQVAADNLWHSIVFDVLPADWTTIGSNLTAALADVTQFRIFSNETDMDFTGSSGAGEFYLDNIRAIGALPGDYNGNNLVDAADYVLWRDTQNQTVTPGSGADGTGPGGTPDGVVNSLDYDFWRARFGNSQPGSGTGSAAVVVPEPGTALVVLSCFYCVSLCRRGKKKVDPFSIC